MKTENTRLYDKNTPSQTLTNIAVVGATGLFGELLCKRLSQTRSLVNITLCARTKHSLHKLETTLCAIKSSGVSLKSQQLDISNPTDYDNALKNKNLNILVNASGPYQYSEQNYALMRWCAQNAIHYIDLADDAEFVMGVPQDIHELAIKNSVSITTGVSSVPALSSSVFRHYKKDFTNIDEISIGITPGNKTKRGLATVRSILSYAGQNIAQKRNNKWKTLKGWGDTKKRDYPYLKEKRYLSNCLSPDNALFHKHYPQISTIIFKAGLELSILHLGLSFMAKLAHIFKFNLEPLSPIMLKISNLFLFLGSDKGAMHVEIFGHDHNNLTMSRKVEIVALDGSGPYIPTLASLMLIDKIRKKELSPGAHTGFELFDVSEFEEEVAQTPALPISFNHTRNPLT